MVWLAVSGGLTSINSPESLGVGAQVVGYDRLDIKRTLPPTRIFDRGGYDER